MVRIIVYRFAHCFGSDHSADSVFCRQKSCLHQFIHLFIRREFPGQPVHILISDIIPHIQICRIIPGFHIAGIKIPPFFHIIHFTAFRNPDLQIGFLFLLCPAKVKLETGSSKNNQTWSCVVIDRNAGKLITVIEQTAVQCHAVLHRAKLCRCQTVTAAKRALTDLSDIISHRHTGKLITVIHRIACQVAAVAQCNIASQLRTVKCTAVDPQLTEIFPVDGIPSALCGGILQCLAPDLQRGIRQTDLCIQMSSGTKQQPRFSVRIGSVKCLSCFAHFHDLK